MNPAHLGTAPAVPTPDAATDPHRWLQDALDAVAGLGRALATEMQQGGTPTEVFNVSRPAIRRLADFETLAFLALSEDGLDFELKTVDPARERERVQREVDHQVAEGTFGWSIYQSRPVIVPGAHLGSWVLLHVLATPRRTMGMMVGSLVDESVFVPDICQKALSILLLNSASVMESGLLYGELDAHNRNLEAKIEERTEELRRSEAAARAASRAKSDFLANMSHEIRTPINGIMGMNSLMLEGELDTEQEEQAETIQRSAESLLGIINDILDFSKIEAGRLSLEQVPFDLKVAVEDVAELLGPKATERGLELAVKYAPDAPRHLLGDPGRLRQVLTNLVGNAVKFTHEGEVVIEVEWDGTGPGEDEFRISVHDTGIGIEEKKLERVFEKFTQADTSTTRMYGGTGLGLSISRELTRMMGGRLSARSAPGQGSTFWFTLPHVPDPATDEAPGPDLAGARFLVVAPNPNVAAGVEAPLRSWGGRVDVADGPDALETLEPDAAYVAAFVDHGLGADVAGRLPRRVDHAGRNGTRMVLMAPLSVRQDALELVGHGYDQLLLKPVREKRIWSVVVDGEEAADPVRGAGGTPAEAASEPGSRVAGRRARVLLTEDDPVNRAVATGMLKRLGCQVDVAENGAEAVEAVSAVAPGTYDLLLMDCQMPVMDGYEATRRLREMESGEAGRLPILALTASALEGDRERGIAAGMDDYLTKPVKMDDIRAILERWLPAPGTGSAPAESDPAAEALAPVTGNRNEPPEPALPDLDVEAALVQVGGDEDLFRTIAGIFLAGWTEIRTGLEQAGAAGDATVLYQMAHRLKGGAGNVGAARVHALSSELEARWKGGATRDAAAAVKRLDQAVEAYRVALERRQETGS